MIIKIILQNSTKYIFEKNKDLNNNKIDLLNNLGQSEQIRKNE